MSDNRRMKTVGKASLYTREEVLSRILDSKGGLAGDIALHKLDDIVQGRVKSTADQLRIMKRYLPALIDYVYIREGIIKDLIRDITEIERRVEEGTTRNAGRPWTDEEDSALIECVADGWSPDKIATTFGRTVPAIKTRVSHLVGINRIERRVAGRFVGTINGVISECDISGVIHKTKAAK